MNPTPRYPGGRLPLPDAAATDRAGQRLAPLLRSGDVLALTGELGAGKTRLAAAIVRGLGSAAEVTSPTFTLVNEYRDGRLPVFHLDLYRLESAGEVLAMGWEELLEGGGVCLVEWADRFPELLPADADWLRLEHDPPGRLLHLPSRFHHP